MLRRLTYGLVGALLSSGPLGFVAVRLNTRRFAGFHSAKRGMKFAPILVVMRICSSLQLRCFRFGYLLGRQVDRLAELSQTDSPDGSAQRAWFMVAAPGRGHAVSTISPAGRAAARGCRRSQNH